MLMTEESQKNPKTERVRTVVHTEVISDVKPLLKLDKSLCIVHDIDLNEVLSKLQVIEKK
jgi:hypothetical protein